MQFSHKKLCLREEFALPRFSSVFPDVSSSFTDNFTIETSPKMTRRGIPPRTASNKTKEQQQTKTHEGVAAATERTNEIVSAFASLDNEVKADVRLVPQELQCRYRKGKCPLQRTLKKNGSLHSYCELHRQRSVRNQKVFDQKRRRQRELQLQRESREQLELADLDQADACFVVKEPYGRTALQ